MNGYYNQQYGYGGPANGYYGQPQASGAIQQPTPSVILGKFVSSFGDIRPNDVPMDGSIGVFPANDRSCIVTKSWTADGRIETVRYIRQEENPEEQKEDISATILERLEKIEKSLNKALKGSTATKKEE